MYDSKILWEYIGKNKSKKLVFFFLLVPITPNFSQWCRARSGTCLNPRDVHLWCQSGRCLRIYCQLMLVNSLLLYNLGTLHINAFCFIFWKFWYLSFFFWKIWIFFGNFWTYFFFCTFTICFCVGCRELGFSLATVLVFFLFWPIVVL